METDAKDDNTPPIAKYLTVPGRLLLIFTVMGGAGLFYWYFFASFEALPAGSYPFFFWLLPVALPPISFFDRSRCPGEGRRENLYAKVYRSRILSSPAEPGARSTWQRKPA